MRATKTMRDGTAGRSMLIGRLPEFNVLFHFFRECGISFRLSPGFLLTFEIDPLLKIWFDIREGNSLYSVKYTAQNRPTEVNIPACKRPRSPTTQRCSSTLPNLSPPFRKAFFHAFRGNLNNERSISVIGNRSHREFHATSLIFGLKSPVSPYGSFSLSFLNV